MLDFIANPTAGGSDGQKIKKALNRIEKHLQEKQIDYSIHLTCKPRHATTLTDTLIRNGATDIIVVGGDGTLHEVINGFSEFGKVNMGIIPCGTGNDFAAALNLSLDPIEALDVILNGKPQYTDFMQMPSVRGLNIIGTGVDVDVLKKYSNLKKKTKFGYTRCLIKTLFNPKMSTFDATLNGETKSYKSFIACIANGKCYGGGLAICPIADPSDKKLNFVTISEIRGIKMVKAFLKLKKGKTFEVPQVSHCTTEEVKIYPEGSYTVNVDGELYDDIPFEVKIVSDTLKVYRP